MTRSGDSLLVALVVATITGACSGTIGDGGASGSDDSPTGVDGKPATGGGRAADGARGIAAPNVTGGSGGNPVPDPSKPADSLPSFTCGAKDVSGTPRRLWRLTKTQYANTVATLFSGRAKAGRPIAPQNGVIPPFDAVAPGDRFTNIAYSYTMTDSELSRVYSSAGDIADLLVSALKKDATSCLGAGKSATADCVKSLVTDKGALLFRRPLTDAEVSAYAGLATAGAAAGAEEAGVRLALQALLMAPNFLFRVEMGEGQPDAAGFVKLSSYEVAEGLAYSLTDAPPTDELFQAARAGTLSTPAQVRQQVTALLGDLRGPAVTRFFREYLRYPGVLDVFKDPKDAPFHKPDLLLADTDLWVADLLGTAGHKELLKTLLTSPDGYYRTDTAQSYGITAPKGADPKPQRTTFANGTRLGFLMQPSFLAAYSTANENKPVQRGRFVRESLLCGEVPMLPIGKIPPLPNLGPNATLRDRLKMHSADPTCAACHKLMDPIGLVFEAFDHTGRLRTMDHGTPPNGTGELTGTTGQDGAVSSPADLVTRLAAAPEVEQCFVRHSFRYWMGKTEGSADGCSLADADTAYRKAGGDYAELLASLFTSKSFLYRGTK